LNGADNLDRAAELTQSLADAAVIEVQRAARPEQSRNPDGSWPHPECVDCGEEQLAVRLQMGRIRCVACQTVLEFHRKGL
jgi:ribosomal protein S27E